MVAFASPEDLAVYLRTATADEAAAGNPDILDTVAAVQALDLATGSIQADCHWAIAQETVTGIYRLRGSALHLPTLHLTAVTAVRLNDGPLLTRGQDYDWETTGRVEFHRWTAWARSTTAAITYTHGYDPVPPAIRGACLERAAQTYLNPAGHLSESLGGVSTTYARRPPAEDPRLAPYILMAGA